MLFIYIHFLSVILKSIHRRISTCKSLATAVNMATLRLIFIFAWFCIYLPCNEALVDICDDMPISLNRLYPTPQNSEIFSSTSTINNLTCSKIVIKDIPTNISFLLLQTHSYLHNLTLSYKNVLDKAFHVNGTNLGLLIEDRSQNTLYLFNFLDVNVEFYLSIHAYDKTAPVPGGCNLEFSIKDSPYMRSRYSDNIIYIEGSPARNTLTSICDKTNNIIHEFYHLYLNEWDFSKEQYFENIKKFINVENVLKYGTKVPQIAVYDNMRRIFPVYYGTGSVYTIIANNSHSTATYVPIHSYSPAPLFSALNMMLLILTFSFCFLLICIKNISLMYVFMMTSLGLFIFYDICEDFNCSIISAGIFLACGILFVILHYFNISPLHHIVFGFELGSLILYGFPGLLSSNYLHIYCILPIYISLLICCCFGKYGKYFIDSINISFFLIIIIDAAQGSYVRYAVINYINKLISNKFEGVYIDYPFQLRDIALFVIWSIFVVTVYCLIVKRRNQDSYQIIPGDNVSSPSS